MPNPAETLYTFQRPYTAVYVRGRANTTTMPVYRDGALAAPSAGTYTLVDESDTAIVSAAAVTVTNDVATYALTDSHLPSTATLSPLYLETWSLTLPDGTTREWSQEVVVARRHLFPVVADSDLAGIRSDYATLLPQGITTAQVKIDAAWKLILSRLIADGRWPHKIMNAETLRSAHMYLVFALLYGDAGTPGRSTSGYRDESAEFYAKYEAAWDSEVKLALDTDQDGRTDDPDTRHASGGVIHVNASPSRSGWYRSPRFG